MDKENNIKFNLYIIFFILSFFSLIIYNVQDFTNEFSIIYDNRNIIIVVFSILLHLFFLFVPFFIVYVMIFFFIDLAIIKNVYWYFKKIDISEENLNSEKEKLESSNNSSLILAIVIFTVNVLLFSSSSETLLSIIYPLNVNQVIDNILGTPCLFCPIRP
ncbi:hypothetical protein [Salegentibacter maritimus]|uniref:hypothetical protein n=1 Tax=Salegentibacter maritimus TaxID=2794347 RepID=UPI0018E41993|nr:hypothetical protein [Salegentibacter maritimus]MBI6117959.1 hypothetical protein [Salegentibacter maritimus]